MLHCNTDTPVLYLLVHIKNSQIWYSNITDSTNMLLLNTIPLSGTPIGEHFITLTCHCCHTIERFAKVFWHFFGAASEVNVRFNVFCSCFFFIIVAIYGNCCRLYNYLWFRTWLVWQRLVHFVEESQFLLWCGISRLGALVFIASIGAYQSVNSCLSQLPSSLSS